VVSYIVEDAVILIYFIYDRDKVIYIMKFIS